MLGFRKFLRSKQPAGVLKVSPSNPGGRRVLILSASAGTGHVRAAEALEKVFRQQPGVGEVRNIDALRFTNRLFRDFYSKLYIQLVQRAPTILGIVYNSTDEPWKTDRMRLMLDRLNTGPLERFIPRFKPDITVCTHFLPSEIISYLITKKKLDARLSIVVTDLDVHAMWLCRTFHRYFVALEESKVHLEVLGLPGDHITVSGIPIDPAFAQIRDRDELRRNAGFDTDRPLFLISGGALGVSPAVGVLDALARLAIPRRPSSFAARTPKCRPKWRSMPAPSKPPIAASPSASSATPTKCTSGCKWPTSSSANPAASPPPNALASGLPMVIVAPIPGQEDRNSDHLLEKGIALKCNEFTTLAYKIDGLLDQPSVLQSMREKARWYGRPNAATTIVETLLNQPIGEAAKVVPGSNS